MRKKISKSVYFYFLLTLSCIIAIDESSSVGLMGSNRNLSRNSDSILNSVSMDTIDIKDDDKQYSIIEFDTLSIELDGIVYKIPVNIPVKVKKNEFRSRNFSITGLMLRDHDELRGYLKTLFNNPSGKLLEPTGSNWTNSDVYERYFEKYDTLRRGGNTNDGGFMEGVDDEPTGIEFPLPATIDLNVNLIAFPKTFTAIGIVFNFDKLDPGLRNWLITFRTKSDRSGVKEIIE